LNQQKRHIAYYNAQCIFIEKYKHNKLNLQKWEDYRETKIEMVSIFIKILKRKKFTKKWIINQKLG